MKDYLTNEIQNTLPTLLKLGVMDKPQTPIESYIIQSELVIMPSCRFF